MMPIALVLVGSYLVGSIPFGVIVGRARGVDIRKHGSGNIGATNVLRLLGPGPAAAVFVGDTVKGIIPVLLGGRLIDGWALPRVDLWLMALALAPILGHSFSIFLRFRGGRAVATTLGVLLGMSWQAGLAGLGMFVLLVALTRYVSIASIGASASVPIYLAATGARPAWAGFWTAIAALIIARHIPNIGRILDGTEPKIGQRAATGIGTHTAGVSLRRGEHSR